MTSEVLSKFLGSYTVQSGSVSKGGGKDGANRFLQMMERPLMTPDELKSIPKGEFVVMKTGSHPMRTRLRLFLNWGITFGESYQTPEHATPGGRNWRKPSNSGFGRGQMKRKRPAPRNGSGSCRSIVCPFSRKPKRASRWQRSRTI